MLSSISPFLVRRFIDELSGGVLSLPLMAAVILCAAARVFVGTWDAYVWQVKMRAGARDLAAEVFGRLQTLPLPFFREHPTGALMARVLDDTEIVGQACVTYYPMLWLNLAQIMASAIVLVLLEWRLAGVALALLPVAYLALKQFNWRQRRASAAERRHYEAVVESAREKIEGVSVIKSFHCGPFVAELFRKDLDHWFRTLKDVILNRESSRGVLARMPAFVAVALLVSGGVLAVKGRISLGTIVAFFWYMEALYAPIEGLVDWNNARQQAIPMGRRVLEILKATPEGERAGLPLPSSPTVSLVNVHASYGEKEVLAGVSAEMMGGRMTAIVGESGSGKSTLVSLLLEFNQPTQGEILINGRPLEEYATRELREGIAFSSSEAFLFNMSIRDNITLGGEYTDAEVIEAAKIAGIHEFIAQLPEGYDTRVGERGTKLSDGERQRIALARALIKRPKILILDEATSGVDSKTEARIYEGLRGFGLTLIVVAHRLSTIYMADRIYVLDGGRVVCQGVHSELLERCPVYRALFEKQLVEAT